MKFDPLSLNNPRSDWSSFPEFFLISSAANLDVAWFNFLNIRTVRVGTLKINGNIGQMMSIISRISLLLLSLKYRNTSFTGESWSSTALKSYPNPAKPIESSLLFSIKKGAVTGKARHQRYCVQPENVTSDSGIVDVV